MLIKEVQVGRISGGCSVARQVIEDFGDDGTPAGRGLSQEAGRAILRSWKPPAGGRSYRISPMFRLYQAAALVVGEISALCVVGDVAITLVVLVLMPKQALSGLAAFATENGWPGPVGIAGCFLVGVGSLVIAGLLAWLGFRTALGTPTEIVVNSDGRIEFQSRLRTIVLEASEITSITTGDWYDLNRFEAVVRHKGGKLTLINQFTDFRDFLATVQELNPTVEIKGF